VPPEIRERGLAMVKEKKPTAEICAELGVTDSTVNRWRVAAGVKAPPRRKRGAAKAAKKTKTISPMAYLADQLAEVGKMIRQKLPELARFTLTTTPDGKANIEYAVRQTTELAGTVKL
jgi:Zn-dependent peptidase ImmA (M78 family)